MYKAFFPSESSVKEGKNGRDASVVDSSATVVDLRESRRLVKGLLYKCYFAFCRWRFKRDEAEESLEVGQAGRKLEELTNPNRSKPARRCQPFIDFQACAV